MKNIECHYKDGSLIFCTTHSYNYTTAHKILDVFNVQGLISVMRKKSGDSFLIIGSLPVNYDPFNNHNNDWNAVISELKRTKETLELEVQAF
ncbi:hypothetical protein [Dyadobacter arcticus]|uniref:Uncharacterized protein n=1 Tax=Dyadobacter arcticus TaxID=1078754 RepID=A0ABX0ULV2_9BACT|nr:hypothetical protein [Dyadobacter arcticus]NIJ53987.1 hypothetical protein [Dyadobacter arcticus]